MKDTYAKELSSLDRDQANRKAKPMKSITINNDESFEVKIKYKGKIYGSVIVMIDSFEYSQKTGVKVNLRSHMKNKTP